jgi:formylglycine-generating enzyme required for sulfatase activity
LHRRGVELRELGAGRWQLALQPVTRAYVVRSGEILSYAARKLRKDQEWLRLPVSGIGLADVRAYAAWLDRSGRVPGARLCTEREWERAARGADDRELPHGSTLEPGDANFDETYGKDPASAGPDEVGSHPASQSPFGLSDRAGNVFEWTESSLAADEAVVRGGSYFMGAIASRSTNRTPVAADFRDPAIGARICATVPPG